MFYLCRNQVVVFTGKMFEKHLLKSDILSKDAGRWPTPLVKMSFFHRCFSKILQVKTKLSGLSVGGTLIKNGLMVINRFLQTRKIFFIIYKYSEFISTGIKILCKIDHELSETEKY